jgi:hypothetical protein
MDEVQQVLYLSAALLREQLRGQEGESTEDSWEDRLCLLLVSGS